MREKVDSFEERRILSDKDLNKSRQDDVGVLTWLSALFTMWPCPLEQRKVVQSAGVEPRNRREVMLLIFFWRSIKIIFN